MPKARPDQIAHLAEVFDIPLEHAEKLAEQLEVGAKTLVELGVDWKEVDPPAVDAPADVPDAPVDEPVAVTEADAAVPAPAVAAEVAAAPQAATASEVETPEPVAAVEPAPNEVILSPEVITSLAQHVLAQLETNLAEMRDVLATVVANQAAFTPALSAQAQTVKELAATVQALKASDDAKIAAAVKDLPRATVKSLQTAGERPSQRPPDTQDLPPESQLAKMKATLFG